MNIKLLNKYNTKYQFNLVFQMCNLVLTKKSDNKMALITLGNIYSTICDQEKAIDLYKRADNLEFELSTLYYTNSKIWKIKFKTIQYTNQFLSTKMNLQNITNSSKKTNKIQIGYIGTTFDNPNHPVSRFIFNILRYHSDKFNVICYQIGAKFNLPLKVTNKTFTKESNLQIATAIKEDNLDILVELMNHTSDRVFILMYKPALIQISYCAFPGTTGIKEIDYKIMDGVSSDGIEGCFTETILKLPNGFHTYYPTNFKVEGIVHNGIHFCCFNNPLKVTRNTLLMWVYLLNRIPDSKLFLQYHYFESKFIIEKFQEKLYYSCIALKLSKEIVKRIFFTGLLENKENILQMYNFMDISLDTFPYNGTTITCKSLFMNVPVFTQMGKSPQSRIGASLLKSIKCDECVIESESMFTFVNRLVKYCEKEKLNELKEKIKRNIMKYELGNPDLFIKGYEKTLQSIL